MTVDPGQARVTAIIPTYKRPRLLRRAVTSALMQGGAETCVCVYDNASGDDTAAVMTALAASDPRVRYYCHAKNIGAAANFNYGLKRVETPFFSILSDDDYLLPGFYEHALASLDSHPDAMFWVGLTLNVSMDGVIWDARVGRWSRDAEFAPPEGALLMLGGMAPAWTGIVFRREVLDLEGLPDESVLGPSDLEYCLRLATRFRFVLEKHPSAVFSINDGSFSATQPLSAFWPGWKRMMTKFETDRQLDTRFRRSLLAALRRDAKRMLFRRGANAVATARLDFARGAAKALDEDYGLRGRACLLRALAYTCEQSRVAQRTYSAAYRAAEARIVKSRRALQARYGKLLQIA